MQNTQIPCCCVYIVIHDTEQLLITQHHTLLHVSISKHHPEPPTASRNEIWDPFPFALMEISILRIKRSILLKSCGILQRQRIQVYKKDELHGPTRRLYIRRRIPSPRRSVLVLTPFAAPGPPPLTFKRLGGPGGAVLVGVEFEGQLSVSSLQLLVAGVPLHPQDLIVVPTPLDSRRERRVTASPQTPLTAHPRSPGRRPHRLTPSSCSAV